MTLYMYSGFMYRDLKPANVLLNADGHIQLVDLGGVIDPKERLLKFDNDPSSAFHYKG